MDNDKHEHDDTATAAHSSMISSTSPYQPTTEPVPHRRSICAGLILDIQYLKSISGILKEVEFVLCVIILICLSFVEFCSGSCGTVSTFRAFSVGGMIFTLILLIVFGLALKSKIPFINWPMTDLINTVVWCLLLFIISAVMASKSITSADKAAIVFGFLASVLYGGSAWIGYRAFVVDRHKKKPSLSHVKGVPENAESDELA